MEEQNSLAEWWKARKAELKALGWKEWDSPQDLFEAALSTVKRDPRVQAGRRQTRYATASGPMFYLGQQIVRQMQMSGRDAKIVESYRSWERQAELYAKGRTAPGKRVTNAKPGFSAHQYTLAVDIVHPEHGWAVDEDYWETLASCVRVVAEKFRVELNHGHHWSFRDSAHIELREWKKLAGLIGWKRPTGEDLEEWSRIILPDA